MDKRSNEDGSGAWLASFERRHGRRLRVLHIGNIANNAFNNARIQRAFGIAADVLSADYYHIMASPEWEEAQVRAWPKDAFFPDWWAAGLGDYRRPRWFAAGPLAHACRYLEAAAQGQAAAADRRWQAMEHERYVRCSANPTARLGLFRRKVGWKLAYERQKLATRLGLGGNRDEVRACGHGALDAAAIRRLWDRRRPGLPFPAHDADFVPYWRQFAPVGRLLRHYDIIQGYAQDGLWALLAGRPYVAYEHGTLRSLPFEDHAVGRLVALVYGLADQVMVTNTDVLPSVDRLRLAPDRVHCLPHAYDDRKVAVWRAAHPAVRPPAGAVVFFSPARQHWRDDDPSATKGNDVMVRAAGRLWAEGRRFRLRLVEWGRDVEATRHLIGELGLTAAVNWVAPMGKQDLWRAYCESHAVLDQFVLPALGGVGFETLALGRRLITRTDPPTLARFFGATPPVPPAGSEAEVAAALAAVLDDPDDLAGWGAAGQAWFQAYHSSSRIMAIQAAAYGALLGAGAELGTKGLDAPVPPG